MAEDEIRGRRRARRRTRAAWRALSFANIGAVYVWIAVIICFSVWKTSIFPNWGTVAEVLNGNAVVGILALALVVPLAAGVFDLSVGYTLGSRRCSSRGSSA